MGMPNSKFGKEIPISEMQEGSLPSTPILTPKTIKLSEIDPRSPSLHIARTPIELLSAAADKLELLHNNETPIRNRIILGIDPRSPTTDFRRTPIIISAAENDLPKKLRNKNLDKVRQTELNTSVINSTEKSPVPPKLLQSSPIKPRLDAHKRRSLVGLLETNIDFTETDLDRIFQEKCKTENIEEELLFNKEKNVQEVASSHEEPQIIQDDVELQVEKNFRVNDLNNTETEAAAVDIPRKDLDTNDIEAAAVDIPRKDLDTNDIEAAAVDIPSETKSAPVTPPLIPLSPILPPKEVQSAPITPPLVDLTADVRELDKKLTNLIYEDDLVVCPRIVKLKDNTERSPLRNRNGNEPKAKSAQKLKVSDKPRRSAYAVSRIPVFKEKKGKTMQEVQCENTPPRNMDKNKVRHRKMDWDNKNTTLYL